MRCASLEIRNPCWTNTILNDSENLLVAELVRGDTLATEAFCIRYRPRFVLIARQAKLSFEDAEDVAQNALIDVLRQMSGFRGGCKLESWMHRILRGHIVNRIRALSSHRARNLDNDDDPIVRRATTARPSQEICSYVQKVLRSMPPFLAALLCLNIVSGMSAREIGLGMGWSAKFVSRKLTEAKMLFREIVLGESSPLDRDIDG